MSFTRLPFDSCAYKHQLYESIGPGEHVLDRNNFCDPCFVAAPSINLQRNGAATCAAHLIDVDSELLGITRPASRCPSKKYLPSDKPFCTATPLRECNNLRSEETRLSNPSCTLRSTGWNRFEDLCVSEQDRCIPEFDYGTSTRTVIKDNHHCCIPKPISQTLALPSGGDVEPPKFCGSPRDVYPLNARTCHELKNL